MHWNVPSESIRISASLHSEERNPRRVFSWGWLRWRAWICLPIAIALSALQGAMVGARVHDWVLAAEACLVGVPILFVIMMAGPLFAVWVRERRLWPAKEFLALMTAILAGLLVSHAGQQLANVYSRTYVLPKMIEARLVPTDYETRRLQGLARVLFLTLASMEFLALGGAPSLWSYWNEKRTDKIREQQREIETLRAKQAESERSLLLLQAQVEPHFIYNTLASVRSLIKVDPQRAEDTINAFVGHLRATLPKLRAEVGAAQSTLSDQIEICRSYLELMQLRIGERLSYRIQVPEALLRLAFPPLLLIVLVENAVKHGVEPKPGSCEIIVEAEALEDGQLRVRVSDTGAGLQAGLGKGVGLANVREQLAARYGERAALTFQNGEKGGTVVTVLIPMDGLA